MNFSLREYQQRALEDALSYIKNSKDTSKALMIAPTGAGKSLYIASIANAVDFPVLVLQPSKELLEQNYAKYISYGNEASIYSASLNKKEIGHVTFATIGSIKKEVEKLKDLGVRLVLIDEAHLQTKFKSQTGKFIKLLGIKKVIGFTATPIELSTNSYETCIKMIDKSKMNIFNKIIHITQVEEVVKNNYWAKINYEQHSVKTYDLQLNSTMVDYTEESINNFFNTNNLRQKIVQDIARLKSSGRKSILVFMPSIKEAEIISGMIPQSEYVTSFTSKTERDEIVNKFKNNELSVVINVNILSIGFDHPGIDAIILARPTNSFTIYYQQVGRGVRPTQGKEDVLIVDYSNNVDRFGGIETIEFKSDEDKKNWSLWCGNKLITKDYTPYNNSIIWFGKHKGQHIKDVPKSYLQWIYKNFDRDSNRVNDFLNEIKKFL